MKTTSLRGQRWPMGTVVEVIYPPYAQGEIGEIIGAEPKYQRFLVQLEVESPKQQIILSLAETDFKVDSNEQIKITTIC